MLSPGLYAMVDLSYLAAHSPRIDPVDAATALLLGGCTALQLRAKTLPNPFAPDRAALTRLARRLGALAKDHDVPFIINDDTQLAVDANAAGVHLGQTDQSIGDARRLLSSSQIVGLSTHSLAQALTARQQGASYIGFGPIRATRTKQDADPVQGLGPLRQVCAAVPLPVVAIGGLTLDDAAEVARAGATAAAAISALLGARDIAAAARDFGERFRAALGPPEA